MVSLFLKSIPNESKCFLRIAIAATDLVIKYKFYKLYRLVNCAKKFIFKSIPNGRVSAFSELQSAADTDLVNNIIILILNFMFGDLDQKHLKFIILTFY